jgi:hypothetical protein
MKYVLEIAFFSYIKNTCKKYGNWYIILTRTYIRSTGS